MHLPTIIQGGMGAWVSNWRLAQAVSRTGQLGVVSGTALDLIFARRLQDGDPGGHLRRALEHFPVPEIAERVFKRFYIDGGRPAGAPYAPFPACTPYPSRAHQEVIIVANFAEIWLAREGHGHAVGLNLLEKIQFPNIISIYGAMLAGVDYILMGAGIPREIPGVMDRLAGHEEASIRLYVAGARAEDDYRMVFDPRKIMGVTLPPLKRPAFLAIISSVTLAATLARKSTGHVDGFVVEGPTAGGHNAPPRGGTPSNGDGPVWGAKDEVDLKKIRDLGRPFWVGGSCASPEKLQALRDQGASGIQVGTFFAFCNESGLDESVKRAIIAKALRGDIEVITDGLASPTGFPFKVVKIEGSLSEPEAYAQRTRLCDFGYLRHPYRRDDGTLGFRCAAEPEAEHLKKGGELSDTVGRKCLCNGLMANVSLPQIRGNGYRELPLVTAGMDLPQIARFVTAEKPDYAAAEVIDYLLGSNGSRAMATIGAPGQDSNSRTD